MAAPLCDFFDWTSHRRCNAPASWVTSQNFGQALHGDRYYCDAHRPPRAHLMATASVREDGPRAPKGRHKA